MPLGPWQALVQLLLTNRWTQAACAWQTVALRPHSLYQCRGDPWQPGWPFITHTFWFAIACSTYAVRLWQAHKVKCCSKHTMLALDPEESWHWAVVTDVCLWEQLPFQFVVSSEEWSRFGFLKMQLKGEPVPALIHGLLQVGRQAGWQSVGPGSDLKPSLLTSLGVLGSQ